MQVAKLTAFAVPFTYLLGSVSFTALYNAKRQGAYLDCVFDKLEKAYEMTEPRSFREIKQLCCDGTVDELVQDPTLIDFGVCELPTRQSSLFSGLKIVNTIASIFLSTLFVHEAIHKVNKPYFPPV